MGRKRVEADLARDAVVQFRCTTAFKDEMAEMMRTGQHRDLSEMIEAALAHYRKELGRKGPMPRR